MRIYFYFLDNQLFKLNQSDFESYAKIKKIQFKIKQMNKMKKKHSNVLYI